MEAQPKKKLHTSPKVLPKLCGMDASNSSDLATDMGDVVVVDDSPVVGTIEEPHGAVRQTKKSRQDDQDHRVRMSELQKSNDWINHIKKRHGISEHIMHGEAGSADMIQVCITEAGFPQIFHDIDPNDTYNMDETGLAFKALLKRSLMSQPRANLKDFKDRGTVVLCCNATGTHKFKLMFIGNAERPRCFGEKYDSLRDSKVMYDSNKTSWMDSQIFIKWMLEFDAEMKRIGKVGHLIMDNCSTHCLPPGCDGVTCKTEGGLLRFRGFKMKNTCVYFLPPKVTSLKQPNDRGIIRAFKAAYRKQHVAWKL